MGEYINSKQIRLDKSLVSCGVIQAHHIPEDTKYAAFSICNHLYHKANGRPAAFVVWSDVVRKKENRGEMLAKAIREIPKCGTILESVKALNPKTGNPIKVWVWQPNHEEVRKWYNDETMNAIRENVYEDE